MQLIFQSAIINIINNNEQFCLLNFFPEFFKFLISIIYDFCLLKVLLSNCQYYNMGYIIIQFKSIRIKFANN